MSGVRAVPIFLLGLIIAHHAYSLPAAGIGILRSETPDFGKRVQHGIASWYGGEQQGHLTSNGEHFDRHAYTAASRHLPYNTIVRVTNEANGHSVQVRINDRGPWERGRILDLSEAAADTLDMKKSGTAKVKVEVISPPSAQADNLP
jgi:rare lipoprotein A (peptidoglycan hydrolase)